MRKHKGIDSGEFFSKKLQRYVQYESGAERHFFTSLESSIDVLWYLEQPLKIHYLRDGQDAVYMPDVLICRGLNKIAVVEIKPAEKYYRASKMDFAALLVREEIEHTIRPYQLAAKSKRARMRQAYLAK